MPTTRGRYIREDRHDDVHGARRLILGAVSIVVAILALRQSRHTADEQHALDHRANTLAEQANATSAQANQLATAQLELARAQADDATPQPLVRIAMGPWGTDEYELTMQVVSSPTTGEFQRWACGWSSTSTTTRRGGQRHGRHRPDGDHWTCIIHLPRRFVQAIGNDRPLLTGELRLVLIGEDGAESPKRPRSPTSAGDRRYRQWALILEDSSDEHEVELDVLLPPLVSAG